MPNRKRRRLDPVNTAVWAGIFLFWPVVLVLIIVVL